jgi:hypothetical protein
VHQNGHLASQTRMSHSTQHSSQQAVMAYAAQGHSGRTHASIAVQINYY